MNNVMYEFGRDVKGSVDEWDIEIRDGIDICLEVLVEYGIELGLKFREGIFSSSMLDDGESLLLDIKNNNYNFEVIGNRVYDFINKIKI